MFRMGPPVPIRERIAAIEADIARLTAQRRDAELLIEDARQAKIRGQELEHDADLQREYAELMVKVLDEQIELQWQARDVLVPKPRKAPPSCG